MDAHAFRESRLYKHWSDRSMFQLTRCRRCDEAHFQFYVGLPQSLPEVIAASRARYGAADDADLHVCISHRRRRATAHAERARAAEGKRCTEIPAGDDPAYRAFVWTRLVGNSTAGRIVNAGRYTVTAIGKQQNWPCGRHHKRRIRNITRDLRQMLPTRSRIGV